MECPIYKTLRCSSAQIMPLSIPNDSGQPRVLLRSVGLHHMPGGRQQDTLHSSPTTIRVQRFGRLFRTSRVCCLIFYSLCHVTAFFIDVKVCCVVFSRGTIYRSDLSFFTVSPCAKCLFFIVSGWRLALLFIRFGICYVSLSDSV